MTEIEELIENEKNETSKQNFNEDSEIPNIVENIIQPIVSKVLLNGTNGEDKTHHNGYNRKESYNKIGNENSDENIESNKKNSSNIDIQIASESNGKKEDLNITINEEDKNDEEKIINSYEGRTADIADNQENNCQNDVDIDSLLKKCSPEKLKEIKTKIIENLSQVDNKIETIESTKSTENGKEKSEKIESSNIHEKVNNNSIILLDSDDDEPPYKKVKTLDNAEENEEGSSIGLPRLPEITITLKKNKCVNTKCKNESSFFILAPNFILQVLLIPNKEKLLYHVCQNCLEECILKIEENAKALRDKKIFKLQPNIINNNQDVVDLIDSDEEVEGRADFKIYQDEDKMSFDEDMEDTVDDILKNIWKDFNIGEQIEFHKNLMTTKLEKIERESEKISQEIKQIDKNSMNMYNEIYDINRPSYKNLRSLDIEDQKEIVSKSSNPIPLVRKNVVSLLKNPASSLKSNESNQSRISTLKSTISSNSSIIISPTQLQNSSFLQTNANHQEIFYALKSNNPGKMQTWGSCKLLGRDTTGVGKDKKVIYRVQFLETIPSFAVVSGKEIAKNSSTLNLLIGTRVIALFKRYTPKGVENGQRYLPGVIGERMTKANKERYLVFSDYGEVQYVASKNVKTILEASKNVWEDVHQNLKNFIQIYLNIKSGRRALASLYVGGTIQVQRNGHWVRAKVCEIDCSIARLEYASQNEVLQEWLYRGSKRLSVMMNKSQNSHINTRRHDQNISITVIDDDFEDVALDESITGVEKSQASERNIARKSTSQTKPRNSSEQISTVSTTPNLPHVLNDKQIYLDDAVVVSRVRHYAPKETIRPSKFVVHNCSPECITHPPVKSNNYSPLAKPLVSYWEREIVKRKSQIIVVYRAPCGRRLRNMYEIRAYLMITKCSFNVENFCFDKEIQVLAVYVPNKDLCPLFIPDVTNGKEVIQIPAINAFDSKEHPPEMIYTAERKPQNFKINTNPEFMACCDCTDDCADKDKCACFQMTIQSLKFAMRNSRENNNAISYVWKLLDAPVMSGVYECHKGCHCNDRCLNKVVQNRIQVKMQLFRTKEKGWGLEACHDIPKGAFICTYAGRLYREADTNSLCTDVQDGDEYFAALDLIETLAPNKDDFESGVVYPDEQESPEEESEESDFESEDETNGFSNENIIAGVRRSSRNKRNGEGRKKVSKKSNSNLMETENDEIMPSQDSFSVEAPTNSAGKLRILYGDKSDECYIMDAKQEGNIGKFFNHSCDPNLFVQNVFVDTHDLRFPWIAFFAERNIKAGEELTWNYNYTVGDVPSKVLFCKCGAKNCKKRIL